MFFNTDFYQTFKEVLISILFKLFHKTETEATLSNSFYFVTVTLIPKLHKESTKKENYRPFSLMNIDTKIFSSKQLIKPKNTSKSLFIMIKSASSQRCRDGSVYKYLSL